MVDRSSGKKAKANANSGKGAIISKYGGYSEDEDQAEERAAAKAVHGPQARPKVQVHHFV